MTIRDKVELYDLLLHYTEEEIDCNKQCINCYYNITTREKALDNCPLLIALEMIGEKTFHRCEWDSKKG